MSDKVYIVYDTKGAGRILGVFDTEEKARRISDKYPAYYHLSTVELNKINKEVLNWVDSEAQKIFLEYVIDEHEKE